MPREIEKWTPSRSNFWCPFSQTLATWLLVQRSYMSKCNQQPRQLFTSLQLTIICLLFRLKIGGILVVFLYMSDLLWRSTLHPGRWFNQRSFYT